jgi:hypothetical protein
VGRSVCGCVNVVVGGDGICKWLHGVRMTIARVFAPLMEVWGVMLVVISQK